MFSVLFATKNLFLWLSSVFWGSVFTELRWGFFSVSGPRSCSLVDFVAWMGVSPDVHLYSIVSNYRYGCLDYGSVGLLFSPSSCWSSCPGWESCGVSPVSHSHITLFW